jgi:hypothetical protein
VQPWAINFIVNRRFLNKLYYDVKKNNKQKNYAIRFLLIHLFFRFQFIHISHYLQLKAYRLSELNCFFILKVANIRCFILIAVEIFHIIVYVNSLERRKYVAV